MLSFKQRFFKPALLLLLSVGLLGADIVHADERILDYQSDVLIHSDGKLIVTETIRINAEGVDIRRGIYRDFPDPVYGPVWQPLPGGSDSDRCATKWCTGALPC